MLESRIHEAKSILSMVADRRSIWALFSGGKDSLVMAHLASQHPNFKGAIHVRVKTGVLSDIASNYAVSLAQSFGWQVIEKSPFTTYAMLVAEYGFPGPQQHSTMYQMLKERALDMAKADARKLGRKALVFATGIRRAESQRRATFPEVQNQKGVIWVCPLINWSNQDVYDYLERYGLKAQDERECLCGAFAQPGERERLASQYPIQKAYWEALERMVSISRERQLIENATRVIPETHCTWGHGLTGDQLKKLAKAKKPIITICNDCEGQLDADGNVGIDPDIRLNEFIKERAKGVV